MPPGYLSGGELEAAFLLLRVDKLTGILSIFRVYMVQNTPKSAGEWVFLLFAYGLLVSGSILIANNGNFPILPFIAGFVVPIFSVLKLIPLALSKYKWATAYGLNVVNASRANDRISEDYLRKLLRSYPIQNLADFNEAYQKVLISNSSESNLVATTSK